jgi:phosphoribosylanthranilate isomerase
MSHSPNSSTNFPISPIKTRIKICGITTADDARACIAAGADALGFVFYPPSPRAVTMVQAQSIIEQIPPLVTTVGLFVNADSTEVVHTAQATGITTIQLHGDELPDDVQTLRTLTHLPIIKALRIQSHDTSASVAALIAPWVGVVNGILLDAWTPAYGGAGHVFEWDKVPPNLPIPLILAGGLTVDNVAVAVSQVQPYAVDVSSGVEAVDATGLPRKGVKDHAVVRRFIQQVNVEPVNPDSVRT